MQPSSPGLPRSIPSPPKQLPSFISSHTTATALSSSEAQPALAPTNSNLSSLHPPNPQPVSNAATVPNPLPDDDNQPLATLRAAFKHYKRRQSQTPSASTPEITPALTGASNGPKKNKPSPASISSFSRSLLSALNDEAIFNKPLSPGQISLIAGLVGLEPSAINSVIQSEQESAPNPAALPHSSLADAASAEEEDEDLLDYDDAAGFDADMDVDPAVLEEKEG